MIARIIVTCFLAACVSADQISDAAEEASSHRVLLHGQKGLVIVESNGDVSWQMPWNEIHDIAMLDNGNILTRRGNHRVVEIDPKSKSIVWTYDSGSENGNAGKAVEIHAFQRLENGNTMIAESGPARIIEVNSRGELVHEVKLVTDHPSTHSDTRLARKLDNGNYLVAQEADGKVREYDADGQVVWEFEVPMFGKTERSGHGPDAFGNSLFSATRLENGNTLIGGGNGHCLLEVTPEKRIVREIHQDDLPGIRLAWVTTVEVLENGNWVFGNCHAGPGQPLLIELNPETKEVVWTLDRFDDFGNNVSNSVLLKN